MRITLISHNLRVAGGKSVGQNIVRSLPDVAPMHDYLMIVPKNCGYPKFNNTKNISVLEFPQMGLIKRWWWEKKVMQSAIESFKPNWIWALGNFGVPFKYCRQSLLFHNPHRVYPHYLKNKSVRIFLFQYLSDLIFKKGLKNFNIIYCQTHTMKKRLNKVFNFPLERIRICRNAISFSIQKSSTFPKELKQFQNKFILLILTKYYPHKNLENIINLFKYFYSDLKDIICVMPVRKNQGKGAVRIIEKVDKYGLHDQIVFVDPIPQRRLGEFFHAADVMFLPTLLESFSGTYLEAMYLYTPILTSDLDFAREICGPAAEYIDPYSLESMKDGILRLKNNPQKRERLVQLGKNQLKKYSHNWPEILKEVLDNEEIEHD